MKFYLENLPKHYIAFFQIIHRAKKKSWGKLENIFNWMNIKTANNKMYAIYLKKCLEEKFVTFKLLY